MVPATMDSSVDDIRRDLEAAGLRVTECERLENDTGHQIRCRGGEVVNIYDSGKVVVQGQNQAHVRVVLGLGAAGRQEEVHSRQSEGLRRLRPRQDGPHPT